MSNATWARSTRHREMKTGQNDINYIIGEIIIQSSSSPFLKTIRKKNWNGSSAMDFANEHVAPQLKESDGEKLKFTTKESLDIENDDKKNKPNQLTTKFELFLKLMGQVLNDMKRIEKVQATKGYSMTLRIVSKKNMEIKVENQYLEHDLRHVGDAIRTLFDFSQLVSDFNFVEPMHFTGGIHRMIKLGFVIVDMVDEYAIQQLKEFDGKKPRSTMNEGLNIENKDERTTQFAGHNCRMTKLSLNVSDDHEDLRDDDNVLLKKVEGPRAIRSR